MLRSTLTAVAMALALIGGSAQAQTVSDVLGAAPTEAWRDLDLGNTLVMTLANNETVVIELAAAFAPRTVENIRTLAQGRFWDGLSINRVQDNYVVQWGDPNAENAAEARSLGRAQTQVSPQEYWRARRDLPFTRLRDGDVYAREVGFSGGFPAARNGREAWLAHCYGMVGVGRDTAPDSGSGAELYVVIGHAPRHLDRNITLVGRVVAGLPALTALPRGGAALGFYERAEERTGIRSVRLASEISGGSVAGQYQVLRDDTATFQAYVEARRNRREPWFFQPAGRIDVCNAMPPVRVRPAG
ncbi:MAG: peptidylprolyl isomerase [Caulobacterales bacterium]